MKPRWWLPGLALIALIAWIGARRTFIVSGPTYRGKDVAFWLNQMATELRGNPHGWRGDDGPMPSVEVLLARQAGWLEDLPELPPDNGSGPEEHRVWSGNRWLSLWHWPEGDSASNGPPNLADSLSAVRAGSLEGRLAINAHQSEPVKGPHFNCYFPPFGPAAIPSIQSQFRRAGSVWNCWYRNTWQNLPLAVRERLPRPLDDALLKRAASLALAQMGKPGVPQLLGLLKDSDADLRSAAAWALMNIQWRQGLGPDAVPALIGALNDNNPGVRQWAVATLGLMGPEAADAAAPLVGILKANAITNPGGENILFQRQCLRSLGKIGPKARRAVPQIRNLSLRSGNAEICCHALVAWWRIERDRELLPKLIAELPAASSAGMPDSDLVEALGEMREKAWDAVPTLVQYANCGDPLLRQRVRIALDRIIEDHLKSAR